MTRVLRIVPFVCLVLLFVHQATAQNAPQAVKDPQALTLLHQSVVAMGRTAPQDSIAAGTIEIVAGSKVDQGTVRILTRGLNQTVEQTETAGDLRMVIYSKGVADEVAGSTHKPLHMEQAATSQCPHFPLPFLAQALNDPDMAFSYVGLETLESPTHHITLWNTYASQPRLTHLAEFSVYDVWIDAPSGVVSKISYEQRLARGRAISTRNEIFFSNYRNVDGILYPFLIRQSLNGTPWKTITIHSVTFNSGLDDKDFPIK